MDNPPMLLRIFIIATLLKEQLELKLEPYYVYRKYNQNSRSLILQNRNSPHIRKELNEA